MFPRVRPRCPLPKPMAWAFPSHLWAGAAVRSLVYLTGGRSLPSWEPAPQWGLLGHDPTMKAEDCSGPALWPCSQQLLLLRGDCAVHGLRVSCICVDLSFWVTEYIYVTWDGVFFVPYFCLVKENPRSKSIPVFLLTTALQCRLAVFSINGNWCLFPKRLKMLKKTRLNSDFLLLSLNFLHSPC